MPTRRRIALLAAIALIHPVASPADEDLTGWPDWLQKAMAQESKRLKSREVTANDEQYRAMLAGKVSDSSGFDGGWYFESDVKSEAPLECYIFYDGADLAALTNNLAEINISNQAENNKAAVSKRSVFATDAGAIDGKPFLAIEWMYTIGEAPNALLGYTKVRAALNDGIAQACTHNYPGYRETFANAFAEFVSTTTFASNAREPYYEEVIRQTLGDNNVGIVHSSYVLDDEGDTLVSTTMASLLPVSATEIAIDDTSLYGWSTPDGFLINGGTATVQNGELVTDLRLGRNDDDDWVVSGTFQGKEIEQLIDGALQPLSELGQTRAAGALFAGDETEAAFIAWAPDADPTRFIEGRVVRDDAETEGRGRVEIGPIALRAEFDGQGSIKNAEFSVGGATIAMTRVWSRGEIR